MRSPRSIPIKKGAVVSAFAIVLSAVALAACGSSAAGDRFVAGEGKVQAAGTSATTAAEQPQSTEMAGMTGMTDTQSADAAQYDFEAKPFPATTKPVQPGPKTFDLVASEQRVKVGEKVYDMWTFNNTVPGPALRVVQGDSVTINLKNDGSSMLPHSVDFHAARINPGVAFASILPGESISYTFTAEYPGVFMYHCGTPPVLQHIGMGMYGMIIVQPKEGFGPPMQEIALVQSELYTSFEDMQNNKPDAFAFNGVPGQYAKEQIQMTGKKPLVRIFFLNAGPSQLSSFHVVGTIFDRVFADGNPRNDTYGRQALAVPASGGGVFEMELVEDGSYIFVSHQFDQAGKGAVGMMRVGKDMGTTGAEHS
jgi:nitrite reductase (NO-forming)